MKRRICIKFERTLYGFLVLLISVLTQDQQPSAARKVNGNIVPGPHNTSLPLLSERANGVNSRYLSAASTASLAAATVAAANGAQSQNGGANSNNNQDARNFLLHQQQQQQQQQQSGSQVNNQQQSQTNQGQQTQQQPQVVAVPPTSANPITVPQFNTPQPQQVLGTPIMSTTYTFNPLTGQFVPSDSSTGSLLTTSPNYNQILAGQQQQQLQSSGLQQVPYAVGNSAYGQSPLQFTNPYGQQQQGRLSQQIYGQQGGNQLGYNQLPNGFNLNQIVNQQRQINPFSRRNGYGVASASSVRLGSNAFGNNQQPIDDDNGLFQQQINQPNPVFTGDNLGLLDSPFGGGNNWLTNNNHHTSGLQQQQQQHFNEQSIAPQPSSVAPVSVLPAPSFTTAFSGPPPISSGDFKNDQCVAADNRHGTCYQASECIRKGGTPMGKCHGGPNSNVEYSGSSYVCCLFDISCGQFAAERFVYFRNPNYPNTYDQSRMCRARIGKLDKGVCQFRLDLLRFDVARPTNGNCSQDMFVVSGQNENYVIPKICGLNDGQHYYVGVDESGVITLHMMMMGNLYRRNFEILITQIPCRSDYSAPAHCLQYYVGTHGTIKSFNYDDDTLIASSQHSLGYDLLQQAATGQQQVDNAHAMGLNGGPTAPYGLQFNGNGQLQQRQQLLVGPNVGQGPLGGTRYGGYYGGNPADQFGGGYPNDLDYTMCIRKESGFCSITYQLSRSESGLQPFAVGHSFFGYNGNSTAPSLASQQSAWHPVSTECRDDYLLIGGVRLCSGGGSGGQFPPFDQSSSIQFAQNGSVLNSAGINQAPLGSNHIQIQQLQNQYNLLMQQLARLQQQQAAASVGNVSYSNGAGNIGNGSNNSAPNLAVQQQQQQQSQTGNVNNLEQQQATIVQQAMLIQQQLNAIQSATNNGGGFVGQQNNNQQQGGAFPYLDTTQSAIITDTTSGPFILRFVSNMARNARGFHIDYRQNPCK